MQRLPKIILNEGWYGRRYRIKIQIQRIMAMQTLDETDMQILRTLQRNSKLTTKELADAVHAAGALPVSFVYQDDPKGLGHAVYCAKDEMDGDPFFVLLGDYFVPDRQMCVHMQEVSRAHGGASVIAVAPVPADQVNRYGIIAGECVGSLEGMDAEDEQEGAVWRITGMVEKPSVEDAPSHLFIVGRYLLSPRIMDLLATQGTGAGGEIQLTDAMVRLLDEEEMYALVVDPDQGCDTGTPAAWAATNARMALADKSQRAAFVEALGKDVKLG